MSTRTTNGTSETLQHEAQIVITCMSPERRDLVNQIMTEWKKYKKDYKKQYGGKPSRYGMIYWLVRYSNLIRPTENK